MASESHQDGVPNNSDPDVDDLEPKLDQMTVAVGQLVVLVDVRQRKTVVRIREGDSTHTHWGAIRHTDLIGVQFGETLTSSKGKPYRVFPVTLSDFIYAMPRGAQVIYPKDLAQIVFNLDLFVGAKVLESGVGSGALSISLLRAGASVTGVELRTEFANVAKKNVASIAPAGSLERYDVREGDAYLDDLGTGFDRAVLDLPEPWRALDGVRSALKESGLLCCFTTNVTQLVELHEALPRCGFTLVTTTETLEREWYINGRVVRPQHRMAAHTGFITSARVAPKRRGSPEGEPG